VKRKKGDGVPDTSTSYTIRVFLIGGGDVLSAPYRYDLPGEAIKDWTHKLDMAVVEVRLVKGYALVPTERIERIHLLPEHAS
jgi:hypothetical protein